MPSLLVRKVTPTLVKKLKKRAKDEGISLEESLRRILSNAIEKPKRLPFNQFLLSCPKCDDFVIPERKDFPRKIEL